MRIKVSLPVADAELLRDRILEGAEKVEHDETRQEEWEAVCLHKTFCKSLLNKFHQTLLIDPARFRVINQLFQKECKGRGRLETLTFAATATATTSQAAT